MPPRPLGKSLGPDLNMFRGPFGLWVLTAIINFLAYLNFIYSVQSSVSVFSFEPKPNFWDLFSFSIRSLRERVANSFGCWLQKGQNVVPLLQNTTLLLLLSV